MSKAADNKIEAKPLLLNLESRIVFTKCKPFKLDVPGRTMIFGKSWDELLILKFNGFVFKVEI